jgi:hypothetical protein
MALFRGCMNKGKRYIKERRRRRRRRMFIM